MVLTALRVDTADDGAHGLVLAAVDDEGANAYALAVGRRRRGGTWRCTMLRRLLWLRRLRGCRGRCLLRWRCRLRVRRIPCRRVTGRRLGLLLMVCIQLVLQLLHHLRGARLAGGGRLLVIHQLLLVLRH